MNEFEADKDWYVKVDGVPHPVGKNHIGVTCQVCDDRQAGHKVEETYDEAIILYEDNGVLMKLPRHPLTTYVCCKCFRNIMGPIVTCG